MGWKVWRGGVETTGAAFLAEPRGRKTGCVWEKHGEWKVWRVGVESAPDWVNVQEDVQMASEK